MVTFYPSSSDTYSFFRPPNSQSTQNVYKTHIFDQKNNQKILYTDLPTLIQAITGNKPFLF